MHILSYLLLFLAILNNYFYGIPLQILILNNIKVDEHHFFDFHILVYIDQFHHHLHIDNLHNIFHHAIYYKSFHYLVFQLYHNLQDLMNMLRPYEYMIYLLLLL